LQFSVNKSPYLKNGARSDQGLRLMTNRKSHTPFRLVPKSTTLDDLRCAFKTCAFRSPPGQLNEDRLTLSAAEIMTHTFRQYWRKVYADIRGVSLGSAAGGVKRQWGCRQQQYSAFSLAIPSETLEIRPALLYSDIRSVSSAFQ